MFVERSRTAGDQPAPYARRPWFALSSTWPPTRHALALKFLLLRTVLGQILIVNVTDSAGDARGRNACAWFSLQAGSKLMLHEFKKLKKKAEGLMYPPAGFGSTRARFPTVPFLCLQASECDALERGIKDKVEKVKDVWGRSSSLGGTRAPGHPDHRGRSMVLRGHSLRRKRVIECRLGRQIGGVRRRRGEGHERTACIPQELNLGSPPTSTCRARAADATG